jgi:hypothetical protein
MEGSVFVCVTVFCTIWEKDFQLAFPIRKTSSNINPHSMEKPVAHSRSQTSLTSYYSQQQHTTLS